MLTPFIHNPLPSNELGHICNSIARFCKSAKFGQYSGSFIEKQRFAGRLGDSSKGGLARSYSYNEQREQAKAMFATGAKISAIAKSLGVHRNSVSNWIKV